MLHNENIGTNHADNESGSPSSDNESEYESDHQHVGPNGNDRSESSYSEDNWSENDSSDNSYGPEQSDSCSDSCWALDYAEEQHKVW